LQQLLPSDFIEQAHRRAGARTHNCLYSPLVVLWLLISQRLDGGAPLESAVCQMLQGLPASFWPNPCKRVRDWFAQDKIPSGNTGAYNQARQKLPLSVVEESCDRIFRELTIRVDQSTNAAYFLDGSTMRMAHSPTSSQRYPAGSNQHGDGHWPIVRVVVAHSLRTGLAMRPEWGPLYGPNAVSEQQLAEQSMNRLPKGSTLVGDANFGVFSVAHAANRGGHAVVLRLTPSRAESLLKDKLRDRTDVPLTWKPSRWDRKSHPDLPADAYVEGRVIVRQVQPNDGSKPFLLALFSTIKASAEEAVQLYGSRWSIETDLRTLKTQLRLDQLGSLPNSGDGG
jgi:hypothetical protein